MLRALTKRSRAVALVMTVAVVFGAFCSVGGAAAVSASGSQRPGYSEHLLWSFDAPTQAKTAFSSKSIAITNANLGASTSASNFVFTSGVSSWSSSNDTKSSLLGALNTHQFSKWKTDNKIGHLSYLTTPPSSSLKDPNVFVITNSIVEDTSSKGSFTSEEIEFEANSYYIVSVDFYAVKSWGSFYLVPSQKFDDEQDPRINLTQLVYSSGGWNNTPYYGTNPADEDTYGYLNVASNESAWRTANFLVRTDVLDGARFKLGLHLGSQTRPSKGVIYFQNPRINQVSKEVFEMRPTDDPFTQFIELDDKEIFEDKYKATDRLRQVKVDSRAERAEDRQIEIDLPDDHTFTFANHYLDERKSVSPELFGTFARPSVSTHEVPELLNFQYTGNIFLNNRAGAGNVMLLSAYNANARLLLDNPFVVKRHQIYMLSFYTLSADGTDCSVRIRDIRHKDENLAKHITPYDSGHVSINTNGKESQNGWALNTVFIVGESYYDTVADIELWVGQENDDVSDYMLVSDFKIHRVSANYYDQFKNNEGSQNLVLDTSEVTTSISNAFFNVGTPRSVDSPYPLKAANWVSEFDNKDEDLVLSGIVNTEQKHWIEYAFAGFDDDGMPKESNYGIASSRPGTPNGLDGNNNVFMMQNKGVTWQKLSSNDFSLNSGVTNIISFDIMRQYYPGQGLNFWVTIESKGREIARLNLGETRTTGDTIISTKWQNYSFAIKDSALTPREAGLSFNMGDGTRKCPAGVVFIDNVSLTTVNDESNAPQGAVFADLTDPKKWFVPSNQDPNAARPTTTIGIVGDTLQIQNRESRFASTVTNTLTETLSGGSFYEYRVRTRIMDGMKYHLCDNENTLETNDIKDIKKETKCKENHDAGVNFRLEGFEGGFEHLGHADIIGMHGLDQDGYSELIFYIRPDTQSELALTVEFGNEFVAVTADVFIKDISLVQIDEADFLEAKSEYDKAVKEKNPRGYAHIAIITESYKEPESDKVKSPANVDWWIVVPSIIMGVAVVLAMAAYLFRRFKFKIHIDKAHTSYAADDRSARSSKQKKKR